MSIFLNGYDQLNIFYLPFNLHSIGLVTDFLNLIVTYLKNNFHPFSDTLDHSRISRETNWPQSKYKP